MTKNQAGDDQVRQFIITKDDDDVRLDRWFKRNLPDIGFAMVSRWARTGQIRVDGKRVDPAFHVLKGQTLRVPPGGATPDKGGPRPRRELTEDQKDAADAMVITQDAAAIVLNKPPGLATQGGSGTYEHVDGLLDAYAETGPRPRLVHRLDKDTSGVLLIARTPGSAAFFSKRFSTRTARKIYWALVAGVPSVDEGLIDLSLSKQPGTGGEKMMVDKSDQAQSARTRYRVLDRAGNTSAWVELQPLTGRTHQLRVHMAAIGHPIIGDSKYGGPEAFLSGSISRKMHLHARRLIIDHPDGTPLDVTAELPPHFAASLMQLGFDEAEGEAIIEGPRPVKEIEKLQAKAHSKLVRKERRGERRGRGEGKAPARPGTSELTKRGPKKGKGSPVKVPAPKVAGPWDSASKPAAAKSAGSKAYAGKSATGKPAGAKPYAGKSSASAAPARKPAVRKPAAAKPRTPR